MKKRHPSPLTHPTLFLCLGILFALGAFTSPLVGGEAFDRPFRIGFSSSMFTDVNENDAKAAVKTWGALIAREQHVPVDSEPAMFEDAAQIRVSLLEKRVDAVGMTIIDYYRLHREIDFAPIFLAMNAGCITERYVLLAHRDSPITRIDDLNGKSLNLHTNSRACLSLLWLDTRLLSTGHPTTGRFLGKISHDTKLAKVVLPVFFRQADACVVTRSGYETLSELNPQVTKQLKVLDESPEMVPVVFAFRANYYPPFKQKLMEEINDLKRNPASQQMLTIFQSENIAEYPASCLDTTLELLATHERLVR